MDGYAVLSSWGCSNGVFQPCPTRPRTHGISVKRFRIYIPVDNTHPLLDIGAALYKSAGCTRGNTVLR